MVAPENLRDPRSIRSWIQNRWNAVRSSYWLLPLGLAICAILLSQLTLEVDERWAGSELLKAVYPGGPEGARAVLTTVASSMIGVAGVVFSITVVALTMASAQLGPRLLRTFLRDWTNQLSMGTFIATFLYCLISLRAVSSAQVFVPAASVTVAVALAVACIAVLIYFIHNATASLQADRVVAGVAEDLLDAIERFAKGRVPGAEFADPAAAAEASLRRAECAEIRCERNGYVQAVNYETLFRVAREGGITLHTLRRAGHFVSAGSVLATAERVEEDLEQTVRGCFLVGSLRTEEQDVEYALNQLVEVALRALSPGINDPFTALTCIDWLGAALGQAMALGVPAQSYADERGRVLLLTSEPDFEGLADCSFNQIRQAARETPAVLIRLVDALLELSTRASCEGERAVLRTHADLIKREATRGEGLPEDMSVLTLRLASLEESLGPAPQPTSEDAAGAASSSDT